MTILESTSLTVVRSTFRVRLLRAARIDGRLMPPGAQIDANAHDAMTLIRVGGALLVDESDISPLFDACRAGLNRAKDHE